MKRKRKNRKQIRLVPKGVELGVVPTHVRFVGGLVPDDDGNLPRAENGKLVLLEEMSGLMKDSPVGIKVVQIPVFPGVNKDDTDELIKGLRKLKLKIHMILMVGGADPMSPAGEDAVVEMLKSAIQTARKYRIQHVSSTSFEEWMSGAKKLVGEKLKAAIAQLAKLHARVYRECNLSRSCIKAWHLEFLRGGEFSTFTNIDLAWQVVKAINKRIRRKFFKVMVDAAHCGDSDLTLEQNIALIKKIAKAGDLGIFHASAKTTRGCLSTADGWVDALLAVIAESGALVFVFVEVFHHEDAALEALRNLGDGHGVDTTDGRTYQEVVIDGLVWVARVLNNLAARGRFGSR